jgi:uncharacterized protein (DUF1499 family)
MNARKTLLWAGLPFALLVGAGLIASLIWPPINDVRTGETLEYADLQPQRFSQPSYRVFDAAVATARALGWEVEAEDREQGEIRAVATTLIFRFKDDVTITIRRDGEGATVNLRSRSRLGKGDFGANARRIRRFQAELAKRL